MMDYYWEMINSESFPVAEDNEPSVVIALDEAHVLHDNSTEGFSRADVLLRTIKEYSKANNEAIWVVFASTTSKVAHFAAFPQAQFSSSSRVAIQGQLRFPPFTQLGWDQNAPVLGKVQPGEVAKAGHILQYGRPLWGSLKGGYSLADLLQLAAEKLCGSEVFDPKNEHHAFAVLAQRFGLDIAFGHRDAVRCVETLVASHLCVCINTTEDRIWSYSTYPSEPILSCAAASLLHVDDQLCRTLQRLESMADEGVVDIGQIGELVSRFLWLLAKDFYVRSKASVGKGQKVSEFDQTLQDCKLVPVVEFLKSVFGQEVWKGKKMEKALMQFKNAFINFSHCVSMDYNIRRDMEDFEQLPIEQWTLRHWERTSAVQCCHDQPLIDKVIPMYFRPQNPGDRAGVSQILISDKARSSSQKADLKDIRRDHWSIAPDYCGPDVSYIAILVDFGVAKSCTDVSLDSSSKDRDMCMRIYASGLDATTYPFLKGRDKVTDILRDLYKRQSAPSSRGRLQNLEDQVRFGASSEPRYMNLKKGKQ
ncbi:hypothetical protein OG21DRAFT_1511473 [Imleria badia]|nr:hypothetical protein OG21DRAFT_1511473 [Imleria badia]